MLSRNLRATWAKRSRPPVALFIGAVIALAIAHNPAMAETECESVDGLFESVVVPPPACSVSPSLICTRGILEGDIDGTFEFTMSASTEIPPVVFFTGESDIQTEDGEFLFGTDMGAIDFSNGNFVTHIAITEGTGDLVGASGRIVAIGVINLAMGTTAGDYVGEVCSPADDL